jgi:hypothetical protein
MLNEEEFFNNIEEWIKADLSEWTHITLLAYFCHKYQKKNGVRFRLVRARKGPTMGKEAADFAKLFRTLAPEDYKDLPKDKKDKVRGEINKKIYNYINWMFDYKFRRGEQSVNGTRLFLIPSIIVEFERMYLAFLAKKGNESKFQSLVKWCQDNIPDIFQRHQLEREEDIKMIKNYSEMYSLKSEAVENKLLNKAKEMGIL